MLFQLNLTQEASSYLICSIAIIVVGCIIFAQYWQRKLRHLLFMSFGIISLGFFSLSNGLAVLTLWPQFIIIRNYIIIPLALFIVVLFDSITRDATDPTKLSITVGLSVALIIYNSDLSTVVSAPFPNGDASLANMGFEIQAIKFALLGWIALVAVLAFLKVAAHSPHHLRKYIYLSLFGILCIGPIGIVVVFTIEIIIPGSFAVILLGGSLALGLGISLKSNLAFVLPFRALRLTVITLDGGVPLFTHTWAVDSGMKDAILFSGMIQGVSGILKESVAEGEVEEIKLTNAVLILQRAKDANIACVLASTKTSKILRGALNLFLQRFLETFAKALKDPSNTSQFDSATKIVAQTFPFIPSYE